jgi:hypothetical protein
MVAGLCGIGSRSVNPDCALERQLLMACSPFSQSTGGRNGNLRKGRYRMTIGSTCNVGRRLVTHSRCRQNRWATSVSAQMPK